MNYIDPEKSELLKLADSLVVKAREAGDDIAAFVVLLRRDEMIPAIASHLDDENSIKLLQQVIPILQRAVDQRAKAAKA